jgi:hypothetical protein
VSNDLHYTPERDQVHEPWSQPAGNVFLSVTYANQKVHSKEDKDANLKGL